MNLSVGIVGLPNVGKSTLFNALLKKQQALVASYPFTTIEPNIGIVPVPDERLTPISQIIGSKSAFPATIKFIDIAGLVKNAHQGEGLGNQFLAHIREVDLICHLLRHFEDTQITHIHEKIDPENDRQIIETELIMADLQTLNKQVQPKIFTDSVSKKRWELMQKLKIALNQGEVAKDSITDEEQRILIADLHLLTVKPVLFVLNISERDLTDKKIKIGNDYLVICAKLENELSSLTVKEQDEYLTSIGIKKSGLENLIQKAYQMLGLITFFSGNDKETHAWTVKKGTTALAAAAVIHSDFAQKFIKAEVISYEDFIKLNGWDNAREKGKVILVGQDYLIKDGQLVHFRITS